MAGGVPIGRVYVKVIPDTKDFRKEAQAELEKATKGLDVKIPLKFDDHMLAEEARRAKDKLQRELNDVKAQLNVDIDQSTRRKTQAELAWTARDRWVDLKVRLQQSSVAKAKAALYALTGARGIADSFDEMWSAVKNLDKAAPKIATIGTAIAGLGASALSASSNVFAIGQSLASIGPAALALPGIFGGMTIGVAAFAVAMKDFNKYFPKFAISGSRATSAGAAWQKLQNVMSNRFWDHAETPIRNLINSLFPQFSKGMVKVSNQLGSFTGALAKSMKGVLNGQLSSMFEDLRKSIQITSRHTDSFVKIIRSLGSVGAGELPRLADWFGSISDNFANWLVHAQKTGRLAQLVRTAVHSLQDLGNVLRYAGSTLAGFARAADKAGGSSLHDFAAVLKNVAHTVNGAKFQKNLTAAFESAHKAMARISNGVGPSFEGFMVRLTKTLTKALPIAGGSLGKALGGIFDALDQAKVQNGVVTGFKNISKAVDNLKPVLPDVARGLAAIFENSTKLASNIAKAIAPALQGAAQGFQSLAPAISSTSSQLVPFVRAVGPLLKSLMQTLAGLVRSLGTILTPFSALANLFGKLPNFVKTGMTSIVAIGVVFGVAAYAVNALSTKVATLAYGLMDVAIKTPIASGALEKLSYAANGVSNRLGSKAGAIAGAAGIAVGALTGLVNKSTTTGKALTVLGTTASGALMGFAAGGPIGAAIGGGIGLLGGLFSATQKSSDGFHKARGAVNDYITTLDQMTGAVTRATRREAASNLIKSGAAKAAQQLQISTRDLTLAATGNEGALRRVTSQMQQYKKAGIDSSVMIHGKYVSALKTLDGALGTNITKIDDAKSRLRQITSMTQTWKQALKGVKDKKVKLELKAVGYAPTLKQFKTITRNLPKKQVNIVLKAIGGAEMLRTSRRIKNGFQDTFSGMTKASSVAKERVSKSLLGIVPVGRRTGTKIAQGIKDGTSKARPNLNPFRSFLSQQTRSIAGSARGQGAEIGRNIGYGAQSGINSVANQVATAAANMVARAIAAARAKAKIKSPSRVFIQIGKYIGQGFAIGIKRGEKGVVAAMNHLVSLVNQSSNKGAKAIAARFQRQMNDLARQYNKITQMLQNIAEASQQIAQGIIDASNPTQLGAGLAFQDVIDSLTEARDKAVAFAKTLKQLSKLGLNATTLQQLAAAGPDAALETAQNIAAAGAAGVKQINDLQKQINKAANQVGDTTAQVMFNNGKHMADGLIAGLKKQQKSLEKEMISLAHTMVKAIKKALKIKSPSRVFKEIGGYVGKGFVQGVKSQHGNAADAVAALGAPSASGGRLRLAAVNGQTVNQTSNRTFNYYAASGRSLSAEEELFAAMSRGRLAGYR